MFHKFYFDGIEDTLNDLKLPTFTRTYSSRTTTTSRKLMKIAPEELKEYKTDNAAAWKSILGGTDFQIVEEDHEYNDITSYTEEPE